MPNKIESTLGDDKLAAFIEELRAGSAKPTFKQIQAAAKRAGFYVSLMAARTFRRTTFKDHLDRLKTGRERSAQILETVRGGAHPLDAVEEAASADLLDAYTSGEGIDVGKVVKIVLQLRASIEQRKDRDRNDQDLARRNADSEAKRADSERRTELLEERLKLVQFDAAKAALEAIKDLRAIAGDGSLNAAEKLERARIRLFGETPSGLKSLADLDARKAAP